MKKRVLSMLLAGVMTLGMLAGCGGTEKEEDKDVVEINEEGGKTADPNKTSIKFGITPSFEHFTEYIPDMMAEWGYDVEIVILDDPVIANTALVEGSVDANYIQHLPYLEAYNESNGQNLYACEPYIMSSMDSIVSKKYKSLDEVPDGAKIAVANDSSNLSVNLADLASIGWIKLKEVPEGSYYTTFDIVENTKNIELLEMDMFARSASLDGDADLAMTFYTNSAAEKYGYSLLKLFDEEVAYPQVVAVRDEDKNAKWVADLMEAMTSDKQVEKINEKNEPEMAWKILFR